jgi:cytochrome o ubiquinol oxidase operon protein cyoD
MSQIQTGEAAKGTFKTYAIGFGLSLLLTLAAYFPVSRHVHSGHLIYSDRSLIVAVITLAITQLFVQLVFFLHLGRESKPRWNLVVFLFAALVVLILVLGTLWIMWNLNYHMAPIPSDQQIIHDEGSHL